MTDPTPAPQPAHPEALTQDEQVARATALAAVIDAAAVSTNEHCFVMLDALLYVYLQIALRNGREVQAAQTLVQAGGQVLLNTVMAQQKQAASPAAPPPTVH